MSELSQYVRQINENKEANSIQDVKISSIREDLDHTSANLKATNTTLAVKFSEIHDNFKDNNFAMEMLTKEIKQLSGQLSSVSEKKKNKFWNAIEALNQLYRPIILIGLIVGYIWAVHIEQIVQDKIFSLQKEVQSVVEKNHLEK